MGQQLQRGSADLTNHKPVKPVGSLGRIRTYSASHKKLLLESVGTIAVLIMPVVAFALEGHSNANSINPAVITPQKDISSNSDSSTSAVSPPNSSSINSSAGTNSTPAGSTTNNTTHVTVNGQSIDVPTNGSIQKTIPNQDGAGTSSVNISNTTSGSGDASAQNSNSTNLNISSSSSGTDVVNNSSTTINTQSTTGP